MRFGERPAGAVMGARGDDILALVGVERREGTIEGGGIDVDGASENVNGLKALSSPSLLLFFDGEKSKAGSTFSLSLSSYSEGSKGRLAEAKEGFMLVKDGAALPLSGDFCASTPDDRRERAEQAICTH